MQVLVDGPSAPNLQNELEKCLIMLAFDKAICAGSKDIDQFEQNMTNDVVGSYATLETFSPLSIRKASTLLDKVEMDLLFLHDFLETVSGRDKTFKLLSYMAKLLTACTSSKDTENKLKIFGSKISDCRVMIRLLDDVSVLHDIMSYGWGQQESDTVIRWCQVIQNIVNLVYSPIEHFAWAGQHKIVSINVKKWDLVTTVFWIISIQLCLVKALRMLQKLQKAKTGFTKSNSDEYMIEKVKKKQLNVLLTCIRNTIELVYAVSYLPPNMLWGGVLKTWQIGALGTISSYHFKIFSLYLRTCYGREQVLNILENLPKLFSRYTSPDTSRKLNTFRNQVTDCLSILSFLDDVPILYWIRLYGLGNKEPDGLIRCCNLSINIISIFHQIAGHIIWASKHNIVPVINIDQWYLVATYFSISSCSINLLKSAKKIKTIKKSIIHVYDQNNNYKNFSNLYQDSIFYILNINQSNNDNEPDKMKKMQCMLAYETMACIRYMLQIVCFINYLPQGFLWGNRLRPWQLGTLGIISSLIHTYQFMKFHTAVDFNELTESKEHE
ncbi:hypothetical protein HN011_010596 [Eciton burchellii]|nr:hypothetical protein HN011_010596 [Eciton burchellii]